MTSTVLDHERCYRAVSSRDNRFDGWFVTAVRTTGIYCRPSCPATTPKRANVEFFTSAATAQQRGYRACKRCRPDASPGSPEWDLRQDVVARSMRLIGDGVVEREGVRGLATRLGYSERHLNRMITDELGVGPLAVARARRAQTARILIETTDMALTDVAFAAGFGSLRQFNDTIREVFASSPTQMRAASRVARACSEVGAVQLRLPVRRPFAGHDVLAFLGARAIPGLESWDGVRYARALRLPHGHAVVDVQVAVDHVAASIRLADWSDLATAVQRVRRLLDLDADPEATDAVLGADPVLGALVRRTPGRRCPGSVDPAETLVRAIIGQQISVSGARTVGARLVARAGEPLDPAVRRDGDAITHAFPQPAAVVAAGDDALPMPASRRDTIRRCSDAIATGRLTLDVGADPTALRASLLACRGIGPWTADYVIMRGLGHPDTFLADDLGVRHALDAQGCRDPLVRSGAPWAPWRSAAVHHLWASLDEGAPR